MTKKEELEENWSNVTPRMHTKKELMSRKCQFFSWVAPDP